MLRIGWIVPGFQGREHERGVPAVDALARELGDSLDLRIFAVRYPPRSDIYQVNGIPVQSFGRAYGALNAPARQAMSALRWLRVLSALVAAHRQRPFSLLHGFWATEPGMLAAIAGQILHVPVLVSCCGGELASVPAAGYGSRLRLPERMQVALALHTATRIGVGSHDLRARLSQHYPWLGHKVRMLPLGFEPAIFSPPAAALERIPGQIVCAASWSPVKDHELLLDALRVLVDRRIDAHLLLVGERTDCRQAHAAVEQKV